MKSPTDCEETHTASGAGRLGRADNGSARSVEPVAVERLLLTHRHERRIPSSLLA
jgi:hypothetical protein